MKVIYFLFLLILVPFLTNAQINLDPFSGAVKWDTRITKNSGVKKGDDVSIFFNGHIKNGMHVFSIQVPKKDANLPTAVEWSDLSKNQISNQRLEEKGKPIKKYDEIFETDVQYYEEQVMFVVHTTATTDGPLLKGELKYQVCDEEGMCSSQTVPFEYHLK